MQTRTSLNGAMQHIIVIPAKAGIQTDYASRTEATWTPAFAGVTEGLGA